MRRVHLHEIRRLPPLHTVTSFRVERGVAGIRQSSMRKTQNLLISMSVLMIHQLNERELAPTANVSKPVGGPSVRLLPHTSPPSSPHPHRHPHPHSPPPSPPPSSTLSSPLPPASPPLTIHFYTVITPASGCCRPTGCCRPGVTSGTCTRLYRFTPLKEEEPPRWHLRANPGAICSSHILNLCPKRCPGSFFSSSWRSPPEPTPICAPTLRPSPARHRLAMKKATRHWRAAPCLAESRCIPEHHLAERCTARLWHVLDEQVLTTCQRPRRVVTAQDLGTRVSHKHHAAMHEIMSAQPGGSVRFNT